MVANLTCTLEAHGMANNTVMVLVSDNGGASAVDGNNYPFAGSKGSISRGGIAGTGLIHSQFIPENMRGQSYSGLIHVTDWLPTFMSLATNGSWNGSLSGVEIDGVDVWSAIMSNASSPRVELVHDYDDEGYFCIQYGMYKLTNTIPSTFADSHYSFSSDLYPDSMVHSCSNPSLINASMIDEFPHVIEEHVYILTRGFILLCIFIVISTVLCFVAITKFVNARYGESKLPFFQSEDFLKYHAEVDENTFLLEK